MKITIANRNRPFSLLPGTTLPLPGTPYAFTIFPARIDILNLVTNEKSSKLLPISGPVDQFAIFLDLEKYSITVQGQSPDRFFRYSILQTSESIVLKWHKGTTETLVSTSLPIPSVFTERLHLGSNKIQDWDLIRRRNDLTEVYPVWYSLGQSYRDSIFPPATGGTSALLSKELLPILFKAGFYGILTPTLSDPLHQGIVTTDGSGSSLSLLSEGAKLIRSLFVSQQNNTISILPDTPPQFHCGRFIGLVLDGIGTLDMEWTKKLIRRMVVRITAGGTIQFNFRHVKKMRIRRSENDLGLMISSDQPIETSAGERILLDRFEK